MLASHLGRIDMELRKLRKLQRAVKKRPEDPDAWAALGAAFLARNERERAILAFQEALRLSSSAERCLSVGDFLLAMGERNTAQHAFERALSHDPEHVVSAVQLSVLLLERGELEAAWSVLVRQLAHYPRNRSVRLLLAQVLERQDELSQALEHAVFGLSLDPRDLGFLRIAARVSSGLGIWDRAAEYWRQIVELTSSPSFDDITEFGVSLAHADRPRDALGMFEMAATLAPERADAHANLGTALMSIDNHDGAMRCLERALAIDPKNAHARCMLGTACEHAQRLDEAVEHFRAAALIAPDWTVPLYNAGTALLAMGRTSAARSFLEEAARIDPADADVRAALQELGAVERDESKAGMTGDLETCRLPDLLELLRLRRLSGTLSLTTQDGEGQLILRDGSLTSAQSPNAPLLGDMLVERGLLTASALEETLRQHREAADQMLFGQRLLEARLVADGALRKVLTEQIVEALREMLEWDTGSFVFRRNAHPGEPNPVLEFDAQTMILDAARYSDESRR